MISIASERGTSRPIAATSVGELPTTLTAPTLPMFDTSDFRQSLWRIRFDFAVRNQNSNNESTRDTETREIRSRFALSALSDRVSIFLETKRESVRVDRSDD
uniref:Uncharacterized protein n=1 Tax=Vespula pensylvanica TaxID=30213 RepID=A0A834U896_VESPE|nr:hypothetical protein H0235_009215 [Vespula pensylvanica]